MTNGGKTTTDFNKIAGAAPPMRKTVFDKAEERRIVKRYFPASSALRNEYDAADEAGKALMIVEKTLEAMVEPKRRYEQALLAKVEAENREMRARIDAYKVKIEQVGRDFAEIKKRDQEARSRMFKARPFAFDVNNPHAVEIALEAVRANPSLLDKLNKPH